jgi:protein-S-isoprenylcysteine O-methyltransferase
MSVSSFHELADFFFHPLRFTYNQSYLAFVINHSKAYTIAALASWTEFWLESIMFSHFKFQFIRLRLLGLFLVIMGQVSFKSIDYFILVACIADNNNIVL